MELAIARGKVRSLQIAQQREKRRRTMLARYGVEHIVQDGGMHAATMHLTDWYPDPDVPGVRMRVLRGI